MDQPGPAYWAKYLEESRVAFGKSTFWERLGISNRRSKPYLNDVQESLHRDYKILAVHGQVVWAAFAQVNNGMFLPGPRDLPGVTIYSPDPYYDQHPEELREMGHACFLLKGTAPRDPELNAVAQRMSDEHDFTLRLMLPRQLTAGREVYLGATMFHRSRLPDGCLQGNLLPLIIAPQKSELNMVLALEAWPAILRANWLDVEDVLQEIPCASQAEQVVEAADKTPYQNPYRQNWNWKVNPVQITERAHKHFKQVAQQAQLKGPLYVSFYLDEEGRRQINYIPAAEALPYPKFDIDGAILVLRREQFDALRGLVMDYRNDPFAEGLFIRDTND